MPAPEWVVELREARRARLEERRAVLDETEDEPVIPDSAPGALTAEATDT